MSNHPSVTSGQLEADEAFLRELGSATLHGNLPMPTVEKLFYVASRTMAAAKKFRDGEKPPAVRWGLVNDSDGHWWLCPVERLAEANKQIEAIETYWSLSTPAGTAPVEPEFLVKVEGPHLLSFTDPREP